MAEIDIAYGMERRRVEGDVVGPFGIHHTVGSIWCGRSKRDYTLTHLRTGYSIAKYLTRDEADAVAKAMLRRPLSLRWWQFSDPEAANRKRKDLRKLVRSRIEKITGRELVTW